MRRIFLIATMLLVAFYGYSNQTLEKEQAPIAKHVVLVAFDGWSAHSLTHGAEMPTVRKLMAEGAWDVKSRSVLPSSSAVNWASMFMGAGPELHGYTTWGSRTPELPSRVLNSDNRFPNIFGLLREQHPEAEIGLVYEWGGIHYVLDTLALNYQQQAPMNDEFPKGCTPYAVDYIKEKKPTFLAVIYDKPDGTGHQFGWESPEYFEKITFLDECLAEIIEATQEAGMYDETIFIVTSDHGGIEKGHGGKTMKEMERPLIFFGKGIKNGHEITESTMIYDIAGTIAYIFNVEQPQVWTSRPVKSAFLQP